MITRRLAHRVAVAVALVLASGPAPATGAESGRLRETARQVVRDLEAGHVQAVAARFDEAMARALPVEKLRAVWDRLTSQVGPLEEMGPATAQVQGGLTLVTVPCRFERAPLLAQVSFDAHGRIAGLYFRPVPAAKQEGAAAPSGVRQVEVTVGKDPWKLPGTLTLPRGAGPFPAVVLVHGSGPHDRDESIGPNRPFRDLAAGLAARGIATLRYEKRTHRYPKRSTAVAGFTVEQETVEDARAAVELLAGRPEIDHRRIFLLGHSLGGTLAPRIAAGDPNVAGLIVLAGATRPLERIAVDQLQYLAGLDGTVTKQEAQQIAAARQAARRIESPGLKATDTVDFLGVPIPGSYWLDLRGYDPAAAAARLHLPMLILQGGRDYQVTRADLDGWKKALAGRKDVTFKLYPHLNHLFMDVGEGTRSTPADYMTPGHVSQEVVRDIAGWILGR